MSTRKSKYWEGDKLIGLDLVHWDGPCDKVQHSLDTIAISCLSALKIAVLAIDQSVTGEKQIDSFDVREFYWQFGTALNEWKGVHIEADDACGVVEEIDELIELFNRARKCTAK